jgi:hypothetical protein
MTSVGEVTAEEGKREKMFFFVRPAGIRTGNLSLMRRVWYHKTTARASTGNGLVVPSSSHKQEVAGSIPDGGTKTFIFPLPLLPHRLMSYFDVWRHLSFHENPLMTSQQQTSSTRPGGEWEGASTTVYWRGAERGDQFYRAISNSFISGISCNGHHKWKIYPKNKNGVLFKKKLCQLVNEGDAQYEGETLTCRLYHFLRPLLQVYVVWFFKWYSRLELFDKYIINVHLYYVL